MASAWTERVLDTSEATREWQDGYCSRFRKWTPAIQSQGPLAIKGLVSELQRENHDAFRSFHITPLVYSRLLLVLQVFKLYFDGPAKPDEAAHMFGHLVEASLNPSEEAQWRVAAKNPEYRRPNLADLPVMFIIDLGRFRQYETAKRVFRFTYFGYRERLDIVVNNSLDLDNWRDNLIELWPYLMLRHLLPASRERGYPDFLSLEEVKELEDEEKQLSENFACTFAALVRLGSREIEDELRHFEAEVMQIKAERGRIEARKAIVFHHRNKLEIPTYVANDLIRRLAT